MRRAEMIEHGMRSERLEDRAIHQAERGHIGRAVELETRSNIQRDEMIGDALRPRPMMGPAMMGPPMMGPAPGVRAAETAMVAGAVTRDVIVAEEVAAANRRREAEMMYAAGRPAAYGMYPATEVYVQPGGMAGYPPGAGYPGGAYPPGVAGYPPGVYPPGAGYPRYWVARVIGEEWIF